MLLFRLHQLLLATTVTARSVAVRISVGNYFIVRLQIGRIHPQALLQPAVGPPRDSPQESRQEQAQEGHASYEAPLLRKQEEEHKKAVKLAGQT